jgi:hypothetical protein
VHFSRRDFLASFISFAGLAGVGSVASAAQPAELSSMKEGKSKAFLGAVGNLHIATGGRQANLHPASGSLFNYTDSVLIIWDVVQNKRREILVPVQNLHEVFVMPQYDRMLLPPRNYAQAAVVDLQGKLVSTFQSPQEGLIFSGHGVYHPQKDAVILSLFKANGDKEGRLAVYDAQSMRLLDMYPSHGFEAHDMSLTRDGKYLAIGHYGVHEAEEGEENFIPYAPSLSMLHADSLALYKNIPVDKPVNLSHLTTGKGATVFGVLEEYMPSRPNQRHSRVTIDQLRDKHMAQQPWPLIPLEMSGDGSIALPTPLLSFDVHAEKIQEYFVSNTTQRRPQTVIYNEATDKAIAAYVFTSHLIAVDGQGKATAYDTDLHYGVALPIGLSEIVGTPYIALAGMHANFAIIDTRDMSLVMRHVAPLYRSSHTTAYIA